MSEIYRIHFGYSKRSKYYPQAVELAQLAHQHEVLGEDEDAWHVVTLTEDQADLMAMLYTIATKLPLPSIYGADLRYTYAYCTASGAYNYVHASDALKRRVYAAVKRLRKETGKSIKELADYLRETYIGPIESDMSKVGDKLKREGRVDYVDPDTQTWVRATSKPQEPVSAHRQVRELVARGQYAFAIKAYYLALGDRFYGELTSELIYLKRLAGIALSGRDLLYFRPESSRNVFVASNLNEYVACINETLAELLSIGQKTPLDVLLEYAPTMEQLIETRERRCYLWDGQFTRESAPMTLDRFSAKFDGCPEGRLFDRYPDQVHHCRVIEYRRAPQYTGLWTTYPPSRYRVEVVDRGLQLEGIEAYGHKSWRTYRGTWHREPEFTSARSLDELTKTNYATSGIEYTGQQHRIKRHNFYEINLLREIDGGEVVGNPFLELAEEVLREAENLLRERHGLPRIGEGWISETQLYRLVQSVFPDAEQHATPKWLRPQHLDVYVPSRNLALEYQGRQHFEPIDFFGGQESYTATIRRDELKAKKCRENGVVLIQWHYSESIDHTTLSAKLNLAEI